MRRFIIYSNNDNVSHLSKLNFSKLLSLGDLYCSQISKNVRNPFWKNIVESWKLFLKSLKIINLEEIVYCPLWENSQISSNGSFFLKDWYDKGIRNILDIINENGLLYDFVDLKNRYNIKGTYLDYARLVRNIPKSWKEIISVEPDKCAKFKYNVQANCYVKFILKSIRGCRDIYDTLIPVDEASIPVKWLQEMNDTTTEEWKMYCKRLNQIREVKLKDFQYKILNRILVINRFLYKIKRKESDKCSYCNKESESITHLLFSCEIVNEFWNKLKLWLLDKANIILQLDLKTIMFSACSQALIHFIIVVAKYYIYKNKFVIKTLSIEGFERYLKKIF